MKEDCSDLKTEAGTASDKHYRAMGDWLRNGRTAALRAKARQMAERYRKALDWLIRCYRRARKTSAADRSLEHAETYKTLVERDIEILDSNQ